MASRMFLDGVNDYHGYQVTVTRFTSAYDSSESGRTAAKHWGTIKTPEGESVEMDGMTTPEIKKMIEKLSNGDVAYTATDYARDGVRKSSEIKELENAIETNKKFGLPTETLESLLAEKIAEDEANRAEKRRISAEERKRINGIKKQIKELEKAIEVNKKHGLDTIALETKIDELRAEIESES